MTTELVRLIDLSLGSQPSGVVNFNYLHTLMHAIVRRLGMMEQGTYLVGGSGGVSSSIDASGETGTGGGPGIGEKEGESLGTAAATGTDEVSSASGGTSERGKVEGEGDGAGGADQAKKEPSPTSTPPPMTALSDSKPSSSHASRTGLRDEIYQPKSTFVTAANDLGAMERKLQELESRLNAMDTLPELLERKSSDMGATPIKDRWNFTNLSKRLSAAEDGLEQVC